MGLLLILLNN